MLKEIVSKRAYLKRLEKKLRFKYSKDDIDNILNDYNEIFDIELAQGKTEKDVCIILGDPVRIVQNLDQERGSKNIFSRGNIMQSILIAVIFCIIGYAIYRINHDSGGIKMLELLAILPAMSLLLWLILRKTNFSFSDTAIQPSSLQIKISHVICFLTVAFLFYLPNSRMVNFNNEQAGIFVVRFLYLMIGFLCGLIVFNIFWAKGNKFALYSVICHALGVITLIIYHISVLHSLTTISVYSLIIKQGIFIYLETVIIISIFIILSCKKEPKK